MKIFRTLAILFVAASIASCESENSQANYETADFTQVQLNSMKSYFETTIMNSSYFQTHKAYSQAFANKIYGSGADMSSRTNFQTWLTSNLSKTRFTTVSAGMTALDNVLSSGVNLRGTFASFYNDLSTLNSHDFNFVVGASYSDPEPINNLTPCQQGCANDMDIEYEMAELFYHSMMTSSDQFTRDTSYTIYYTSLNEANESFNDCMGDCH